LRAPIRIILIGAFYYLVTIRDADPAGVLVNHKGGDDGGKDEEDADRNDKINRISCNAVTGTHVLHDGNEVDDERDRKKQEESEGDERTDHIGLVRWSLEDLFERAKRWLDVEDQKQEQGEDGQSENDADNGARGGVGEDVFHNVSLSHFIGVVRLCLDRSRARRIWRTKRR
jgi:hypothetical protein